MRFLGAMFLAAMIMFAREARAGERPPIDGQIPPKLKTAAFGLG